MPGIGLLLVSIFVAACGAGPVASASGQDGAAGTLEAASHGGEISDYASLVDALRAAGASVEPGDSVEQPFFAPTGQLMSVDGESVQIFEFESSEARQEAAATISPDGSSVGTSMMTWIDQPNFWGTGRVIVLYVGSDSGVIDLLTGVLGEPITKRSGA